MTKTMNEDRKLATRTKLQRLIDAYEAAIFDPIVDVDHIARCCTAVEAEAQRVGYDNHRQLMALHTMAERACLAVGG